MLLLCVGLLLLSSNCFGTDGSGHLTRKEVGAHLPALGLAVDDATLTKLLGALDTNNDDSLDFEEFASLAAMIKLQ